MKRQFSVLMSLYYKEKPNNLIECLDSLLNQTVQANEWVIVKDGPLTEDLESVLKQYDDENKNLIKFVTLKNNVGLGKALRIGINSCSNELIARMDTDDICLPTRFEIQLKEFEENKELDICGCQIKEFEDNINNVVSIRKVPINQTDMYRYQKKRSAFNHMTVMYKKQSVLDAGNYQHAPLMEDDLLWINMMLNNCKCLNIDEYLVFARIGLEMISRRGGINYFKKYQDGRKTIYKTGYISYLNYLETTMIQLIVSLMPKKLRLVFFKKALRR